MLAVARVSPVLRRRRLTGGMAAARAKNVVVAVVPNGRTLGLKRYPLPQPVVGAMATLTKR